MLHLFARKNTVSDQVDEVGNALKVVVDLDQLLPKPVGFILHGKKHVVNPVQVGQFGMIYERCAQIDEAATKKKITGDALHTAYVDALRPICPTLERDDVARMTAKQRESFFVFVFKVMSGEAFDMPAISDPSEKKN